MILSSQYLLCECEAISSSTGLLISYNLIMKCVCVEVVNSGYNIYKRNVQTCSTGSMWIKPRVSNSRLYSLLYGEN